ncbi:RNA-binding protein 48 [Pseudophryne corroboree]|uniref:RNA-binding protein 48 n=1 Tax=Pseudophryne corroboree TaxID=495146 RepID=UPI00308177E1
MASADPRVQLEPRAHHEQRRICASRAKYREGRKPRAVKVYTINLESRYLLVQGVPAIGVMKELIEHFALFGAIEEYNALDEYPAEEFTEVYLIKFQRLQSARVAKRKLDERTFFGGLLHICYAPEFESVQETREKLQDRRRYVARATSEKDWPLAKKAPQEAVENSSSVSSFVYTTTPAPTVQPIDSVPCFMPPPLITPDWQEYSSTSSPSASDSRNQSPEDDAYRVASASNTGRASNPAQNTMGSSTARFLPRTTQLQERQRRRERSTALALSLPDSQEIVIGPKLPEIPKLDLDDDSLNTSATVIRGKLKQVSDSYTITKPEASACDTQSAPPVKQRRRI